MGLPIFWAVTCDWGYSKEIVRTIKEGKAKFWLFYFNSQFFMHFFLCKEKLRIFSNFYCREKHIKKLATFLNRVQEATKWVFHILRRIHGTSHKIDIAGYCL